MGCDKVPELIDIGSDNLQQYEEKLYNEYKVSFEDKQFFYKGKKIVHKQYPLHNGKPATFWHIISSEKEKRNREFDVRRAALINYPAHILRYCKDNCDKICIWENTRRRNKKRILLWCKDINYLVVLDQRKNYYIFWTAYPVIYSHAQRRLENEYNEYCRRN